MLRSSPVALRACIVSFAGPTGVRHSVEVTAETLFEAAVMGLHLLRSDGWVEKIGPGTQVCVEVTAPSTTHYVTVAQLKRWTEGVAVSPDETLKKRRMRELLA